MAFTSNRHRVHLNWDILALLSDFLTNIDDVLSFSLTCSTLRTSAVSRLLRMKPIALQNGASIYSLHKCIFADERARAPHVRALLLQATGDGYPTYFNSKPAVDHTGSVKDDAQRLIDILSHSSRLECLHMYLMDEDLGCLEDPRVFATIAALITLKEMSVVGWSSSAMDFIKKVQSPLKTVRVIFQNDINGYWTPQLLDDMLAHLAPTLETVEVDDVCLTEGEHSPSMTPLVNVRSLHVRVLEGRPLVDVLLHMFPSVKALSLGLLDATLLDGGSLEVRADNLRAQARGTWARLDRLVCDASMFVALGLRCPIRHLMIDYCYPEEAPHVAQALRENPPRRLKLSMVRAHRPEAFDGLFTPELGDVLTHRAASVSEMHL